MAGRLLAFLDRIFDRLLATAIPARWSDGGRHECIRRHPSGKGLRAPDAP